jgi:hypothetical protein
MPANPATLSLCVIFGNESNHIERFIDSFKMVSDEFVFVRAIGSREPDDTIQKIEAKCKDEGIKFQFGEYVNYDEVTRKWPHVDRFDKARQMSFDLATCEMRMWADCDDVLPPQSIFTILEIKKDWNFDIVLGMYDLPSSDSTFRRERIIGRVPCRWISPVHEALIVPNITPGRVMLHEGLVIEHKPLEKPMLSVARNLKILEHAVAHPQQDDWEPGIWFYIHRDNWIHPEAVENGGIERSVEAGLKALTFPGLGVVEKYEVCMNLNEAVAQHAEKAMPIVGADQDKIKVREKWLLNALRLDPSRREAVAALSMLEHDRKASGRALAYARMMRGIPEPDNKPWTHQRAFYSWKGALVQTLALRRTGQEDKAREIEEHVFGHAGRFFSVLHATRRADEAVKAMFFWLSCAHNAGAIEWIFAVDEDDQETLDKLVGYRVVTVKKGEGPGGPVAAWNAAAKESTGKILIQMSDDWIPISHWDAAIVQKLGDQLDDEAVLRISDGHRKDDLMCMAILTRKYYDRYGYVFYPEYFSMYSDNEFTKQAERDDVVINAKEIVFQHFHPAFHPEKAMDAVYERSNSKENYANGFAIFCRRSTELERNYVPVL